MFKAFSEINFNDLCAVRDSIVGYEPDKFSATATDLTKGYVGVGTLGGGTAQFDDVTVTQR